MDNVQRKKINSVSGTPPFDLEQACSYCAGLNLNGAVYGPVSGTWLKTVTESFQTGCITSVSAEQLLPCAVGAFPLHLYWPVM